MRLKLSAVVSSILLGLVLLGLQSGVSFAQVGVIHGTVVDEQGNPIEDVLIRIEGMEVSRKYKVETNKDGEYLHAGVSLQGTYRVIAEKEGYRTAYVEGVPAGFDRNEERGKVDFTLTKGEGPTPDFDMTDEQRQKLEEEQKKAAERAKKMEAVRESFNAGVQAYNAGDYEGAVESFNQARQQDAEQPALWANLGNSYSRLNRNEEALKAYEKAIELDPNNASFYRNVGSIHAQLGNAEEAKKMYEKSIELSGAAGGDPKETAVSYYNMGVTFINAGQTQEAAEALRKAVEADPSHAEAHYQLGITLVGLNEVDEAITHFQKYLELAPGTENAQVAEALIQQLKADQ